jgi:hypothetical protein
LLVKVLVDLVDDVFYSLTAEHCLLKQFGEHLDSEISAPRKPMRFKRILVGRAYNNDILYYAIRAIIIMLALWAPLMRKCLDVGGPKAQQMMPMMPLIRTRLVAKLGTSGTSSW